MAERAIDAAPRRPMSRRRRRRLTLTLSVAAVLAAAGAYLAVTLTAPLPAATVELSAPSVAVPAPAEPDWPEGIPAAAGVVGHAGALVGPGGDQPLPIASITKLITALVVLDAMPLQPGEDGPTFTMGEQDMQNLADVLSVGGSYADIEPGEQLTQLQLLQGMLVPSADNFALSLAQRAFGDNESYVKAARAWLDQRGLTDVSIVEPTGLEETDAASASDLVQLGVLALENPVIAETVRMRAVTLPVAGTLASTNQLLDEPGVIGIKTGHTDVAGYCFVLAEQIEVAGTTQTVVAAVLDAPTITARFTLTRPIVASMPGTFAAVPYVAAGDRVGTISTAWGAQSALLAGSAASGLVWNGESVATESSVDARPATAPAGTAVGTLSFTYGQERTQVPVVTGSDVAGPDAWWRLTHPLALLGG